ncbi:hypothetical protein J132_05745 [Termitomyces sp. J132]|nr:hypothetical protein J132_05745 [Termitomyces sp. J132]
MLARFSALRSFPRLVVVPVRHTSSKVEGSVAQSKEFRLCVFSKKEAAHENEYVHRHDLELLAKLKAEIEKKQQELDELHKVESELKKQQ